VKRFKLDSGVALFLGLSIASCRGETSPVPESAEAIHAVVVKSVLLPDEVCGFGSLSFACKVDVSSPQEAVIEALPFREGDRVPAGAIVAVLRNTQLTLAVERAENGVAQAMAAMQLADARLFEGRLAVESRLAGIEKAKLEAAVDNLRLESENFRDVREFYSISEDEMAERILGSLCLKYGGICIL